MVDDKYVGIALAIAGTFAIGTSFIVTKKVENLCAMIANAQWVSRV